MISLIKKYAPLICIEYGAINGYYSTGNPKLPDFVAVEKSTVNVSKENRRVAQETKNLRLVGISWLDTVETASVMIEDTEKEVTYFLKEGEKIGNSDIVIKTIYAESTKLGYEDEEIIITYDETKM